MKNIFKIITILFLSILTFSCSSENNSISDEQNIEEQALILFQEQINKIKTTIKNNKFSSKEESQVAVVFDVRMEGTNYIIENIEYLNDFEYGFAQGYLGKSKELTNLLSKSSNGAVIKVSCNKTGDITSCPELSAIESGIKQARCLANVIKSCLNGGEFTEACKIEAIIQK